MSKCLEDCIWRMVRKNDVAQKIVKGLNNLYFICRVFVVRHKNQFFQIEYPVSYTEEIVVTSR